MERLYSKSQGDSPVGKSIAGTPDNLRSSPGAHMVEERMESHKLSSDPHICAMACMCPPCMHAWTYIWSQSINKYIFDTESYYVVPEDMKLTIYLRLATNS